MRSPPPTHTRICPYRHSILPFAATLRKPFSKANQSSWLSRGPLPVQSEAIGWPRGPEGSPASFSGVTAVWVRRIREVLGYEVCMIVFVCLFFSLFMDLSEMLRFLTPWMWRKEKEATLKIDSHHLYPVPLLSWLPLENSWWRWMRMKSQNCKYWLHLHLIYPRQSNDTITPCLLCFWGGVLRSTQEA